MDSGIFPSSSKEKALCGLVLDLIDDHGGLQSMDYLDAAVIVAGRHVNLLIEPERSELLASCRAVRLPNARKLQWRLCLNLLFMREAIATDGREFDPRSVLNVGWNFDRVRVDYPAIGPSLIRLAHNAAKELRYVRDMAMESQP